MLAYLRPPLDSVEFQIANFQYRRRLGSRAPCERLDSRHQLGKGERLGQVVVGADVESGDPLLERAMRGKNQHRRLISARPQLAEQIEPILSGQLQIENYQVERAARDYWFRGLRALGGFDGKAFLAEPLLDGIGQTGLVLDQQDAQCAHTLDAGMAARPKKAPRARLLRLVHGETLHKANGIPRRQRR